MRVILITLALITLIGCAKADPAAPALRKTHSFTIYMFDTDKTGDLGETVESAWAVLQAIPLDQSAYTITDELITAYDWDTQTFTMTNEWGERGQDIDGRMWDGGGVFLVIFDGQRLFGGRIIYDLSPTLVEYPVLILGVESQHNAQPNHMFGPLLTYRFRPTSHIGAPSEDLISRLFKNDPALAEAVRQHLADLGKLQ